MFVFKFRLLFLAVLGVLLAFGGAWRVDAAKAPSWLSPLLEMEGDAEAQDKGALVLLDEAVFDYNERGVLTSEARWAVKVYDRKKRDLAKAAIDFEEGLSQVTHFRAWMIDPNGKVYKYEKKDAWDVASESSSLHSATMVKRLDLSDDVREGCVFAYEYKLKKKTVFSQLRWYLNGGGPVARSAVSVIPPKGWEAKAFLLSGAKVEERRAGDAYVWEAKNLSPFEVEFGGPVVDALQPRLGISLIPTEAADRSYLQGHYDWAELAAYDGEVNDSQIEPNEAIRGKVAELCAGLDGDWERMAAIARYAQSVNYVAINTNLSLGGGYKPFEATEVFARHYGDCKDKTALMRSMLKSIGKESYAVSADVGKSGFVDPVWPSLYQFNHCIVAIPVNEEVDAEAVVEDPWLGRIMLFDPTSETAPFGKLPNGIHGSLVLVGSEKTGGLTKVPHLAPEQNRLERELSVTLSAQGGAVGSLEERSMGSHALRERLGYRKRSESEYMEMLASWISQSGSSARIEGFSFEDDFEANRTLLSTEFSMPVFARSLRGKYLVFKPFQLSPNTNSFQKVEKRTQPFVFTPSSKVERVVVSLPEGFAIDDFMDPVFVDQDFARYEAKIEEVEGKLVCSREIVFYEAVVPAERSAEVNDFYQSVLRAEQSPVVLALME